ncbi:MAG: hypothetical protein EPO21_01985 [Chloroflexota bacterium]|nr:MAG: hypothetical protein EPO21_01985 [Chloroflexota bacterium]
MPWKQLAQRNLVVLLAAATLGLALLLIPLRFLDSSVGDFGPPGDVIAQAYAVATATPTPTPPPPQGISIVAVGASPNPFNPLQSGTTLKFNLSAPCGNTLAAIFDMNGAGVLKYWGLGALAAGNQSIPWDGKNSSGVTLGEGLYAYYVVCLDAGGNTVGVGWNFLNISPIIYNMTVQPGPYDPVSGNATLGFNLSQGNWAFTTALILSPQGTQVKVFPWQVSPSGPISYIWDGRDGAGNVVPYHPNYLFVVAVVDPSNTNQMHVGVTRFGVVPWTPRASNAESAQAQPWSQEAIEQLRKMAGVSH